MGQADTLTSHESTHFLWNTWPQPTRFLHHCPCLIPSRQTTHAVSASGFVFLENLNLGSFFRSLEDSPFEELEDGEEWRWSAAVAIRRRMAATPRNRKKKVVIRVIIMALRIKDRNFWFGFGTGGAPPCVPWWWRLWWSWGGMGQLLNTHKNWMIDLETFLIAD